MRKMHVNTVAELQAALTTLTQGIDPTNTLVTDDNNTLGLEVYKLNDAVVVSSGHQVPA